MPIDFVTQSSLHVAVLPDGNGRWAVARGWPRRFGHRAGVDAVCRVVRAAPELGIDVLTLHSMSCDNRRRPAQEVDSILACIRLFLARETPACELAGVRVTCLGRRDRLPADLRRAIDAAERATQGGTRLHLRLAIDYSARDAIRAAFSTANDSPAQKRGARFGPDVDLLLRAGGERRLSDFLLWECAYAELVFVDTLWPDFGAPELAAAVAEFRRRERRFGALPGAIVGDHPPLGSRAAASPPPHGVR